MYEEQIFEMGDVRSGWQEAPAASPLVYLINSREKRLTSLADTPDAALA